MMKSLIGYLLWALVLGTALLSPGMISLGIVPLSVLALAVLTDPPGDIRVARTISKREVKPGEEIEITVEVTVGRGLGPVVIRDPLPKTVALTSGNNVGVFFKGLKPLRVMYTYRIKPMLRGTYRLPKSEITTRNPLGTRYRWGIYGGELVFKVVPSIVRPKASALRRRKTRINVPETSFAIRGPISTDFKEIRDYVTGDPVKFINWKATARIGRPLVNEFEKEGKKSVLFIVDARDNMKAGICCESPYEHAINLIVSMTHAFLRKDYQVGLYLLGAKTLIPPSTGPKQLYTIVRTMLDFERLQTEEEGLEDAVERLRRTILQHKPLTVYVSNVFEPVKEETKRGILALMRIHRGRPRPIVLDITTYPEQDPNANLLIEMEKRAILTELENTGAYVVRWMPGREGVGEALLKLLGEVP